MHSPIQKIYLSVFAQISHTARAAITLLTVTLPAISTHAAAPVKEMTELHILTSDGGTITPSYLGTSVRAIGSTHKIASKPAPGFMLERWVDRHALTVSHQRTLVHTVSTDPYRNVFSAIFVPSRYPEQAGSYSGLVNNPHSFPVEVFGQAIFTITSKGSASVRVLYKGTAYRFSGLLDGQGAIQREFKLRGGNVLKIEIGADAGALTLNEELDSVISYQRLVYSAKNPMVETDPGRFNLTHNDLRTETETETELYQPAFITLDIKRTGQVNYIACSPWGEKITGSSVWGTGEFFQLYSFKGGKYPRHIAGQAYFDGDVLYLDLNTCSFKTSPLVHAHSTLSGSRYIPISLPELGAQQKGLELTYDRPADLSQGSQTWSIGANGALKAKPVLPPGPRPSLSFHRPTGIWAGTLHVPSVGKLTFLALHIGDQAKGIWSAPAGKPTPTTTVISPNPLGNEAGTVQLQIKPFLTDE